MSLPSKLILLIPAAALLGAPDALAMPDGNNSTNLQPGVTHIGTGSTNTDIGAGAGARSGGNVSGDINSDANSNQNAMIPTASDDTLNTPSAKERLQDRVMASSRRSAAMHRKKLHLQQQAKKDDDARIDTSTEAR